MGVTYMLKLVQDVDRAFSSHSLPKVGELKQSAQSLTQQSAKVVCSHCPNLYLIKFVFKNLDINVSDLIFAITKFNNLLKRKDFRCKI